MMNIRRGDIAIVELVIALIVMVASLYVPHHHHEESICIGNYDCKSTKHHSHHDECGGKDKKNTCCLDEAYLDFRCLDDDQSYGAFKGQRHMAALIGDWQNDGLDIRYKVYQHAVFLPRINVVPELRLETRRGPPAQFVICNL